MASRTLLHAVFRRVSGPAFAVEYWGEGTERYGEGPPLFTLQLNDPHMSGFSTNDVTLAFGEAYMAGRIDLRGDLADLISLAIRNESLTGVAPGILRNAIARTAGITRRSLRRQREDVSHHYDLGNDFYRLWLDRSMTYSCACFRTPDDTLEEAQQRKLDYSLRKLRLQPGESLLDIGCGWGSLVVRAAEAYSASVLGITLSEEQCRQARETIRERGLGGRADVRTEHYETLEAPLGGYDKIISIGMVEHVGEPHLPGFVDALKSLLRPGGLALLHQITNPHKGQPNPWIDKNIFPGGYNPTLAELSGHLSNRGFRIWDVENLGPHYALTLDHWSERFERNVDCVRQMYGEPFVRMWRLYLRGCAAAFREGTLDVHQLLVSRGNSEMLPLTRDDLYAMDQPHLENRPGQAP